MSRKHKKSSKEQVVVPAETKNQYECIDRSAHWERLLIYGNCNRCERAFSLGTV